jgi:hypothetical protein
MTYSFEPYGVLRQNSIGVVFWRPLLMRFSRGTTATQTVYARYEALRRY